MVRAPRRWTLRNPRNDGGPPLTAAERVIHEGADLPALVAAVVVTALDDLDAGYDNRNDHWPQSNNHYWRAQSYLWFFHGNPTGFERFIARLGIATHGRLPPHPLLDDAAALMARRPDLARLGLPLDLFDARIAALNAGGKAADAQSTA